MSDVIEILTPAEPEVLEVVVEGPQGPQGDAGREVELQKTSTHVQWRYVGDVAWTNLVPLADITGPQGAQGLQGVAGDEIELQKTATHVQWRYVGGSWTNLVALTDITGPANTLTVGTVTTGEAGSNASASVTGSAPNQTLNLTIPRGDTGATGPQGPTIATENAPATNNILWEARTGAFTAVSGGRYVATGTFTVTNPATGNNGEMFQVVVASGTVTVNGVAYAASRWPVTVARVSGAWTTLANSLTENLTLNGTNSTAPNQTSASGSSIMTRDLVRDESFFLVGSNFYPRTFLFGNSGAGSSAAVASGDIRLASMGSGTATSGFGRITVTRGINNTPGLSGGGIRFGGFIIGAAVRFVYGLSNSAGALDNRIRFIIGGNGGTPATADNDPLSVVGFGWEIRSVVGGQEWRLFAHNGTSFTGGAWQIGYQGGGIGVPQYLSVVSNGAGGITGFFGVEGSRTLTTATISGGPTTSGNSTNSFVDYVVVNSSTGTPINVGAGLSEIQILCRPA